MIVILDRQHQGKPQSLRDMGAWSDFDLDGRADWTEQEAVLTLLYGHLYAPATLRAAGIDVLAMSDGAYADRHARVNALSDRYPRDLLVYVALHVNASTSPNADYGSVFYHYRSAAGAGPHLARLIAESLRHRCPELGAVKTVKASPSDRDTARAFSTFSGVKHPICICFEPGFIGTAKHAPLWSGGGLERVGAALADGIIAYARELSPTS